MSTQTVRQACKISDLVERDDLVDQIANLEDLNDPASLDAENSSAGTILPKASIGFSTQALSGCLVDRTRALFHLSQSMGGGKTHSLIAFGLLARDPALRQRIVPKLADKGFIWRGKDRRLQRPPKSKAFPVGPYCRAAWACRENVPLLAGWCRCPGDR